MLVRQLPCARPWVVLRTWDYILRPSELWCVTAALTLLLGECLEMLSLVVYLLLCLHLLP